MSVAQDACDKGLDPDDFVEDMKKKGIRVAGIGHRIKSKVGRGCVAATLCSLRTLKDFCHPGGACTC